MNTGLIFPSFPPILDLILTLVWGLSWVWMLIVLPLLDSYPGLPPLLASVWSLSEGCWWERPAQLHGQSCIPPLLVGRQILTTHLPPVPAVTLPGKGKGR